MSRILSKTFAIALAAGVAVSSPAAMAAPGDDTSGTQSPAASARQTIDASKRGSLTIDKRAGDPGATEHLEGMKFKIEKIKLDNALDTAAGWTEAGNIVKDPAKAIKDEEFEEQTLETNGEGTAKFSDLPVGMYRVTELPVEGSKYTVGSPFFVTIPLTENDGSINYNPTVSPKNQLIQPTKTSDNKNANVGDTIKYTITAPVPAGDVYQSGARSIPELEISDDLNEHLDYADTSENVSVSADNLALDRDTDYTVTINGKSLRVAFTEEGLKKLADARKETPDLQVKVEFNAKVLSIPANGQIENTATEHIKDNEIPTTPGGDVEGPTVTHYNDVSITKNLNGQATEDGKNGSGAQFQIFECTEQGSKWSVAEGADPIKGANSEGTAAADATIEAEGDSSQAAVADGYFLQFDPDKDYCAVETKAPAGYLVNPDPHHLEKTSTKRSGTERILYTAIVDDVKDNIWGKLPATGMRTMLIILGLGALLFIGGAAYQLKRRNA